MVHERLLEAINAVPVPNALPGAIAVGAGAASLVGLLARIRDRVHLLLLLIAPSLAAVVGASRGWTSPRSVALLSVTVLCISVLTYNLLRWKRVGFGPAGALAVGGATPVAAMWIMGAGLLAEDGRWWLVIVPAGLVSGGVLAAGLTAAWRAVAAERPALPPKGRRDRAPEEAAIVLDMLREGKVSAREAADLLEAVREAPAADRLPLHGGVVASLLGGLEIAIGWTMPWRYAPFEGGLAYESGFHVRPHGWLVLVLGVVPAVLACVPALDRYVRQGMLRLFVALIGLVLTMSMFSLISAGAVPEVGLVLCMLGFLTQVLGALKETRLVPPRPQVAEAAAGDGRA